MGCITHEYKGKGIRIDENAWCLCCFPTNYWDMNEPFDNEQLKTMAYFTIAIRLIDAGHYDDYDVVYIPNDLPENMRRGVDSALTNV